MPVDYSRFDKIEDSDEEPEKPVIKETFSPPSRGNQGGGYQLASSSTSKSSRPSLEPTGLKSLNIFGGEDMGTGGGARSSGPPPPSSGADPMTSLAEQLEKWAGTGGDGAAAQKQPPAATPGKPQVLCVNSDGMKKLHTTYYDGAEMVEEYDAKTDVLMVRKTRKADRLGRSEDWVFEVGQAPAAVFDPHADLMRASTSNPLFLRKDTPEHFQWRIRNLSYPADVYSVTVDHEKQDIVVRTSNKKYYKRIDLLDIRRNDMKLKDELLSWKHQHNTLIISYAKPQEVKAAEQKALRDAEKAAIAV